jgi:transposase-like protein
MEDYPKTVLDFEQRFATEEACRRYLAELRWPDGFCCPHCGEKQAWATQRGLFRCKRCDVQTSLTAGTIFQDTRKPLRLWFRALWHVTNQKQGVSALGLQRALGLGSYRTAWLWLHKLRRAMVRPGRDRLSGNVEVDETFIGGVRSGDPGRGAAGKSLVLVAAEQVDVNRIGRIRLLRIEDASMSTLHQGITQCVEEQSLVRSDGWRGYNELEAIGYRHEVIRSEDHVGEQLLPLAHRVASLLKRWLLGTHQGAVRSSHLDYYLDEFTFRFNRRTSRSRGKLFYRLAQQALQIEPVPGQTIAGQKGNTPKYNIL